MSNEPSSDANSKSDSPVLLSPNRESFASICATAAFGFNHSDTAVCPKIALTLALTSASSISCGTFSELSPAAPTKNALESVGI